eukprot:2521402-Rhodomonas_salina.2
MLASRCRATALVCVARCISIGYCGCDLEADDAMLEPRRYSQLGARLVQRPPIALCPSYGISSTGNLRYNVSRAWY